MAKNVNEKELEEVAGGRITKTYEKEKEQAAINHPSRPIKKEQIDATLNDAIQNFNK